MPGGSRSSAPAQHCSYFKTKQITDSVIEKECPQDAALAGLPSLIYIFQTLASFGSGEEGDEIKEW